MKLRHKFAVLSIMSFSSFGFATTNTLYQVSTIGALTQGVYDGSHTIAQLQQQGNFGLGTFEGLNGEMVALDGQYYYINAKGNPSNAERTEKVPFAEVVNFIPASSQQINHVKNFNDLTTKIIAELPNKNIPYAIKMTGTFNSLKLRSLYKQQKTNGMYPNLAKASSEQNVYQASNTEGTLVGFWFPKYIGTIAVPSLHLHYISYDKQLGGHVLDANFTTAQIQVMPINRFMMDFPDTDGFKQSHLNAESIHKDIKKAEN